MDNSIVDQALQDTDFPAYNTARDYPDAPHTHVALPNQAKYKVGTPEFNQNSTNSNSNDNTDLSLEDLF